MLSGLTFFVLKRLQRAGSDCLHLNNASFMWRSIKMFLVDQPLLKKKQMWLIHGSKKIDFLLCCNSEQDHWGKSTKWLSSWIPGMEDSLGPLILSTRISFSWNSKQTKSRNTHPETHPKSHGKKVWKGDLFHIPILEPRLENQIILPLPCCAKY